MESGPIQGGNFANSGFVLHTRHRGADCLEGGCVSALSQRIARSESAYCPSSQRNSAISQ